MNQERYLELRGKITYNAEYIQMWGSWVQVSAFIATHKVEAPGEELDNTFEEQHMLYWVDRLATQYFEDTEAALLSTPGYCEEMESTARFSDWFINHMETCGGAKQFAEYQNALVFNSQYLDTL